MIRFKTLAQFHRFRRLPQPAHPLLSIVDLADVKQPVEPDNNSLVFDFYMIGLKRDFHAKVKYGQQSFDYDSGLMAFQSPGQVIRVEPHTGTTAKPSGWIFMIHPDFLWNTPLATKIKQYEYFDYAVNEALFLSGAEEDTIGQIITNINKELNVSIDRFSQEIIIAQLETLFAYCHRFYQRQFLTRRISSHQVLDQLNHLLEAHFNNNTGLPSVSEVAGQLGLSPRYLSSLLRAITGMNTQQHIHEKLIGKAKEMLSTTELSVGEIAYALGFEHLPSFSKFFKSKTNSTPLKFRQSFN